MDRRDFAIAVAAAALVGPSETHSADRSGWVAHGLATPRDDYGTGAAQPSSAGVYWRVDTDKRAVALTFDDGPDPEWTPQILEILDDYGVAATFFMTGEHVDKYRDVAREVAQQGHALANHSFTHAEFSQASYETVRKEITDTDTLLREIASDAPRIFRPPYGALSGATLLAAGDLRFDVVLWSDRIASRGTVAGNHATARDITPGGILIGHDGGSLPNQVVIDSLPGVIETLQQANLRLVTIPALLAGLSSDI